jgi:hypothetical protein
MKSKNILLGMLVMVLAFGLTVIGCPDDDGNKKTVNPEGEWNGTYTPSGSDDALGATIVFTASTWTLTYLEGTSKTITGTYSKGLVTADLHMTQGALNPLVASAIVTSTSLTFTFNSNAGDTYNGGKGDFRREKPPADVFNGNWTGTYTLTGGDPIDNATINFTDNEWTLTAGSTTRTGTYEKTLLGTTADLKVDGGSLGATTVGTAVLNLSGNLTVTITNSSVNVRGRGTFTKN